MKLLREKVKQLVSWQNRYAVLSKSCMCNTQAPLAQYAYFSGRTMVVATQFLKLVVLKKPTSRCVTTANGKTFTMLSRAGLHFQGNDSAFALTELRPRFRCVHKGSSSSCLLSFMRSDSRLNVLSILRAPRRCERRIRRKRLEK